MLTVHACRGLSDTWALREPPHRHIAHRGEEHKPIDTQKEALCIVGCLVHRRSSANRPLFHLLHRSLHNDTTLSPKQQHPRIPNCSSLRPGRVPASKRSIPQLFTLTRRPCGSIETRSRTVFRVHAPKMPQQGSHRLFQVTAGGSGCQSHDSSRTGGHAQQSKAGCWAGTSVVYRCTACALRVLHHPGLIGRAKPEGQRVSSLSLALFRAVTNDRL